MSLQLKSGESMIGGWIFEAIVVAFVVFVATIVGRQFLKARRARARLQRMKATPTSTVALAPLNEIVELTGTAATINESALVVSPFSGTRCLWWRVTVSEETSSSLIEIAKETDACDFYLDDASGAIARVRMDHHAKLGVTNRNTNPAHEEAAKRFLAKLKIDKPVDKLFWFEEHLDPETEVYVLGHARPPDVDPATAATKPKGGPFRPEGGRRERFVVEAPPGGELVVSVGHEALLATKLQAEAKEATSIAKITSIVLAVLTIVAGGIFFEIMRELGHF